MPFTAFKITVILNLTILTLSVVRCQSEGDGYAHFMVGYGSLMNQESRDTTGVSTPAIPVRMHHIERSWNYHVDKELHPKSKLAPYTAVGCQYNDNYNITTNAVIFEVNGSELHKWDQREARYNRTQINNDDIEILWDYIDFRFSISNKMKVWVYLVPEAIALPIDGFLDERIMKQDYIDICLSGCLEIGDKGIDFALEFIRTTKGWQGHYIERSKKNPVTKIKKKTKKIIDLLMQNEFSVSLIPLFNHNDNNYDYSEYLMDYALSDKTEPSMNIYVFIVFVIVLLMIISYYFGKKNKLKAIYIFCSGLYRDKDFHPINDIQESYGTINN